MSIEQSLVDFPLEIIVIDNASSDGSQEYIGKTFPGISYHYNSENVGFARANNQGIRLAKGLYVLLLNPDTILQEDTLQLTVDYFDSDPLIGALGVRMIDGSGSFLPESKRALPTPMVAFYKVSGLGRIFPKSAIFNQYYLGHLSETEIHEIDVLTGAFMLMRKEVLEEVGLLDESFFMYGEDIDLSFRIKKAGFKIIYFPKTSIIHFKGESTKKDSFGYVKSFYGAMILFAQKHYGGSQAQLLGIVLKTAIVFKAVIGILGSLLNRLGLMLLEGFMIVATLTSFSILWAKIRFNDPDYYDPSLITTNIVIYATCWILALFLSGAYDEAHRWRRIFSGWLAGWVVIAILYAFFDPSLRPSRFIVFSAGPLVLLLLVILRSAWHKIHEGTFAFLKPHPRRFAIIGDDEEVSKVLSLFKLVPSSRVYVGQIMPSDKVISEGTLGTVQMLDQLTHFHQINELVFCSKNLNSSEIMRWMTKLGPKYLYKIAPDQAVSIIGSQSKNKPGEWFTFDVRYNINSITARRNKRLLDFFTSMALLISTPIIIWIFTNRSRFLKNLVMVLAGRKTWVSYASFTNDQQTFPSLKPGVLTPIPFGTDLKKNDETIRNINFYYARDYTIWKDVSLIYHNFAQIGK